MVPEPGTLLGIYRLTRRIGAGGMGEVWKAEDTRLHRNVAIKLLPASMTGDEESRARLLREARTAGQLYHPNIATIHGIELDGETPYIVMEYVEGESLTQAIGARRLTEPQIAEMGRAIADALAEAHAKGIVHRDVKPDNVIVAGSRVKVLDFGIAKRYGDAAQAPPGEIVTEAGVVLGTVSYMSPEQATGKALDGRSDIFSLGVMLYQALTGQLPFRGNSNLETLKQILRSEPAELTAIAPAVSPDLARIVARCLRKPVEERYQSAAELAQDLARIVAFGMMQTPPRPVPLPSQPAADSGAITMVQPVPVAPDPGSTVGATKPTLPGLTRPELAVPAPAHPAQATTPPAPDPMAPGLPPNAVPIAPPSDGAPPAPASSHMQWIVAGASFVIVLAIAVGFVIAKLLGPDDVARTASAPAGASAAAPRQEGGNPPARFVAPPAAAGRKAPAQPPAPAQPSPAASIVASASPAASANPARDGAKEPYRAAMDALEAGAWRHLDDRGAIAPAAEAAEPLFRSALEEEPGHASAELHLAVIALFRRRYDAAQKSLFPLLTNDSLSFEERTIASFAYSASAVAPSGNGVKEFEASLDQALTYYGKQPQFASFARDVRWLVKRSGR